MDDFLESTTNDSVPEIASFRYHLDLWKTTRFTCRKCGGEYLGAELADGELFGDGLEKDCPKCQEPILFLVFETVDELAGHPEVLAPDERENFARRSDFVERWQAVLLRSPEQLPDLSGDRITLFWDTDHDSQEIIIRTENQVIWRQPLGWEHYEFFVGALEILKAKYSRALADVIPTESSKLHLWGDRLRCPFGPSDLCRMGAAVEAMSALG